VTRRDKRRPSRAHSIDTQRTVQSVSAVFGIYLNSWSVTRILMIYEVFTAVLMMSVASICLVGSTL